MTGGKHPDIVTTAQAAQGAPSVQSAPAVTLAVTVATNRAIAAAHRAVKAAVKSGALVRPRVCEHCAAAPDDVLNGHHADYSKPLAVVWLCEPCHRAEHARLRAIGQRPYDLARRAAEARVKAGKAVPAC